MAKILYYSVHEALEYDEVLLFEGMGHTVFSLGIYCSAYGRINPFRPALERDDEHQKLQESFCGSGCLAIFNNVRDTVISSEFIDNFDIIIVMHDIFFIAKNWDILKHKPVVWRTIGQAIDFYDPIAAPYRKEGLKIVRWSPKEQQISNYIGHDKVIRAYKDPAVYYGWSGRLSERFVTFCSAYKLRYPTQYDFFQTAIQGQEFEIGGGSNEDLPNSIGLIDFQEQIRIMRESLCYVYFHGSEIPYTLNFIEAWMTGIPLVAIDKSADINGVSFLYNEINDLIVDGVNGFRVKSPSEARAVFSDIISQRDDLAEIGRCGRLTARTVFGKQRAEAEWQQVFTTLLSANATGQKNSVL